MSGGRARSARRLVGRCREGSRCQIDVCPSVASEHSEDHAVLPRPQTPLHAVDSADEAAPGRVAGRFQKKRSDVGVAGLASAAVDDAASVTRPMLIVAEALRPGADAKRLVVDDRHRRLVDGQRRSRNDLRRRTLGGPCPRGLRNSRHGSGRRRARRRAGWGNPNDLRRGYRSRRRRRGYGSRRRPANSVDQDLAGRAGLRRYFAALLNGLDGGSGFNGRYRSCQITDCL